MHMREMFDLRGRVAVITGGSIGLGRQMAQALGEMGADLVLSARKKERCEQAANELRALGVRTVAVGGDVGRPEDVQAMVDTALRELGRIDILVNNAGQAWGAKPEDMRLEDWNKVIQTNLTGTFLCAQAAGRVMIEQGGGKIVNMASVAGLGGGPPDLVDAVAYSASKGGVIAFTRDLATKWAQHRINVNAIAPGWFPTHMSGPVIQHRKEQLLESIPLRRFGTEHDLKGAIVFLASAASDYVTGHVLVVDGGQSIW
jgi:NAD(P)-dependent dehydrogenase (short-subunit alcohol dehydrogenase family)